MNEQTPCGKCDKKTDSLQKKPGYYICTDCGNDKSDSDFEYWKSHQDEPKNM